MAMQYVQDENGIGSWVDDSAADAGSGFSGFPSNYQFDPAAYGWTYDDATSQWKDSSGKLLDLGSTGGSPSASGIWNMLTGALSGKGGVGQQLLATAGIGALLNSMGLGSSGGGFSGYKGGIPHYTMNREMLPIPKNTIVTPAQAAVPEVPATDTTAAVPAKAAVPAVTTPRRPGSGGVTYFTPATYTPYVAPASGTGPNVLGVPTYTPPAPVINDQGYTTFNPTIYVAKGGAIKGMASGGISSLGGYSDGGQLLRGPGDGVSDSIPATIGGKQKAALADGEFVIPARIVSELGNGSTEAGARKLYAMMDRIKKARSKAKNIAADTKAYKHLPA